MKTVRKVALVMATGVSALVFHSRYFRAQSPTGSARQEGTASNESSLPTAKNLPARITPTAIPLAPDLAATSAAISPGTEPDALQALNAGPLDEEAGGKYLLLFQAWLARSPQAAAKALDSCPACLRSELTPLIASAWAKNSPNAALAWALEQPHPGHRLMALESALAASTPGDPLGALDWVAQKLPPAWQTDGMQCVLKSWFQSDPERAGAAILGLSGDPRFRELLRIGTDALFATDPAAAVRLIEQAGLPADEDDRLHAALKKWDEANPAAVTAWLGGKPSRSK